MKNVILIFICLWWAYSVFAQTPQSFNYQAVVRDANGNLVQNQNVQFRFSIIQDNTNGTVVYQETHQTTTNNLGLVTLAIGHGIPTQGSFSSINWASAPHFLKVEVDISGGSNFVDMGTTQLLSVPYALVAQKSVSDTIWVKAGNNIYNSNAGRVGIGINAPTGKVTIQGDTSNVLFEVRDKDGNPVFVVYQDSVHVFVSNSSAKANKGCFAVNPKAQTKAGAHTIFRIVPDSIVEIKDAQGLPIFQAFQDSVQVFVDNTGAKANKGCFAVNPKAQTKAGQTNYLRITPDSSRVYTEDPEGGFGVRDLSGGSATSYMQLTPDNYFIGHEAGENLNNGIYNLFLGYQSGKNLYSGNSNISIGYKSGFSGYNLMDRNIFIGNFSGFNTNSSSNIFIGENAGYHNIKGYKNIFIGNNAGYSSLGYDSIPSLFYHAGNILIGDEAGKMLSTLQSNTIIGSGACRNSTNSTGSTIIGCNAVENGNLKNSIAIGFYAGETANGQDNIYLGNSCGRENQGNNNVFIGNTLMSYASNSLKNKFIIHNGGSTPLMFGDFSSRYLVIRGDSSNNSMSVDFFVNGTAGGVGAWISISDKKFKTNIQPISNPLEKIMKLNGITYNWIEKSWGEAKQLGFIAQDVEKVLPEVVIKNGENYGIQYAPITALLVEGIKAQQKKIEELEKEINKLKEMLKK